MDAIGFGYKKGQIPQMDEFSFPADEKLRKLAAKVCKEVNPEISVFEGESVPEISLSQIRALKMPSFQNLVDLQ